MIFPSFLTMAKKQGVDPKTFKELRTLIQTLIDGKIEPDSFLEKLNELIIFDGTKSEWEELVRFVKDSIKYLQYHMIVGSICLKKEGILPPCDLSFIRKFFPEFYQVPIHCLRTWKNDPDWNVLKLTKSQAIRIGRIIPPKNSKENLKWSIPETATDPEMAELCKTILRGLISIFRNSSSTPLKIYKLIQPLIYGDMKVETFFNELKKWNISFRHGLETVKLCLPHLQRFMILGKICMKEDGIMPLL